MPRARTKVVESKEELAKKTHSALRWNLRYALVEKQESEEIYKRQIEEDADSFDSYYSSGRLLKPPFAFPNLYKIFEEGDVLAECVDAMQQNVDGFGYQLQYLGDDQDIDTDSIAKKERVRGENFFDRVNDEQSITTIRKLMRQDVEILGNGAFEVIRNRVGDPQMMFYLPFRMMRLAPIDKAYTKVNVNVKRDGKMVTIPMRKYFRRYCLISRVSGLKLRWFKQFGDPRILDSRTGQYVNSRGEAKEVASEIMHFKIPFGDSPYGVPRWIQTVLDILGRRNSQYVNWDLFQSQGIPPIIITVSGGVLTDESLAELETVLRSARGTEKWNRIMLLESNPESQGLEDKGSAKIEIKPMTDYRKEDQMFTQYLDAASESIRHRYRLPPIYTGRASAYTHATSKTSKEVAEEQIFIPERSQFDEPMNTQLLPALGITKWKFVTKGPQIVGSEEISGGVSAFTQAGAFTVNHAIEMANSAFGLQMSKFKEPWANYPVPIVLKLLEMGRLSDVQAIAEEGSSVAKPLQLPFRPQQGLEVAMKSDAFSEEEKVLYFKLKKLQALAEIAEVASNA